MRGKITRRHSRSAASARFARRSSRAGLITRIGNNNRGLGLVLVRAVDLVGLKRPPPSKYAAGVKLGVITPLASESDVAESCIYVMLAQAHESMK